MAKKSNAQRARKLKEKIERQLRRSAGKGLKAAAIFLMNRVKETVSVPAPRRRVVAGPKSQHPGEAYYVATSPAIKGAPPRKLSGRLRQSVGYKMKTALRAVVFVNARSLPSKGYPGGFNYPRYHEKKGFGARSGEHPFLLVTVNKYRRELKKIMYAEIKKGA
jgi:hypothetical protein